MGLADDLKTFYTASWDTSIIAKPTFKVPPNFPNNHVPGVMIIDDRFAGNWLPINADGLTDTQVEPFELTVCAANETDAIKYIRAAKKVTNSYAQTNGQIKLRTFLKKEESKITIVTLTGDRRTVKGVDEF